MTSQPGRAAAPFCLARSTTGPAPAFAIAALLLASAVLLIVPAAGAAGGYAPTPRGGTSPLADRFAPAVAAPAGSVHPAVGYVNPFQLISKEPAPEGIADFGVTASAGVVHAYSYGTPVFQGNVRIDSLYMTGGGAHYMTFQLNDVVVFNLGGQNYSYWIQDIASIDTQGKTLGWIDNIWNLSGSSGALTPAELSGNGTVNDYMGSEWYADSPSGSFPGGDISIAYPFNLSIRTVDSTIAGTPMVGFEYNDGYGWVTFDNATFHHMHGATNYGFVVDGYAYTPIGIFYDAEWDYAGSGGGQHNIMSNLSMSLVFWNGHNYQSVPNAWNFGSDTGESVDNVIAALGVPPSNGSLYARLTNGSGTLGLLYNSTMVGTVQVSTPSQSAGTLYLNGTPIDYRGGSLDLTLAPGSYGLDLVASDGVEVGGTNLTVAAGQVLTITLPVPRAPVVFQQVGLPVGTSWSVSVDGVQYASALGIVSASEVNGSHAYVVDPVPGYLTHQGRGTLDVTGGSVTLTITFFPFNFTVSFDAYGLPAGTSWGVELNTSSLSSTSGSIQFASANGSYSYLASTGIAFIASPGNGTVSVDGSAVVVSVQFVVNLAQVSGSVYPANATVTLDGSSVAVVEGSFAVSEVAGNYSFEATATGYAPSWDNVTLTPGATQQVSLTLTVLPGGGSPGGGGSTGGSSGSSSLSSGTLVVVGVLAVGIVVIAAIALVLRRKR